MIGCTVISMENYRTGVDDGNDLDFIDFNLLVQNLEVCLTACILLLIYETDMIVAVKYSLQIGLFIVAVEEFSTVYCFSKYLKETHRNLVLLQIQSS